jgi:hypothetical protein
MPVKCFSIFLLLLMLVFWGHNTARGEKSAAHSVSRLCVADITRHRVPLFCYRNPIIKKKGSRALPQ